MQLNDHALVAAEFLPSYPSPKDLGAGGSMATIEVDAITDQYLEFAAGVAGISKGEVVAQLVARVRQTQAASATQSVPSQPEPVPIHADYAGHRTHGVFHPGPGRIEITTGDLAGQSYQTPSAAARAVVGLYKPGVSPHRNGWAFWSVSADGNPLQTIRYRHSRGLA
jgi:hypothetical protein